MTKDIKAARITIEMHTPDRLASNLEIDAVFFEYDYDPHGVMAIDFRLISARVNGTEVRGLFFVEGVLEGTISDICADCCGDIMAGTGKRGIYVEAIGGKASYELIPFEKEMYPMSRAFTIDKEGKIYPTVNYNVYRIPSKAEGNRTVHFAVLESLLLDRMECKSKKHYNKVRTNIYTLFAETITIDETLSKAEYDHIHTFQFAVKG